MSSSNQTIEIDTDLIQNARDFPLKILVSHKSTDGECRKPLKVGHESTSQESKSVIGVEASNGYDEQTEVSRGHSSQRLG